MEFAQRWGDRRPWVVGEADGPLAGWAAGQRILAGGVLFSTSGSAGIPKQVVLSRAGLERSARTVNAALGVDRSSVWGLALPRCHVGGFGVELRAHLAGCRCVAWEGRWSACDFAAWVAAEGVTHVSLVPTQVHDLVAAGMRAAAGLRVVVVGGGRLGDTTGAAARALGWPVLATYGLTEAASQVATAPLESLAVPYRAAPLRVLPHWQVCIGEGGRLWLRGESLFQGRVEGTAGDWGWVPRKGEWFATADRAEATTDGWLKPLGRIDCTVKVLGELVDPLAIEERLGELGGSAVARRLAVVAVPDPRAGHRLVLVVEEAVGKAEIARMLDTYHREAKGFARLSGPVRFPTLPRGSLGKPLRAEIATKVGGGAFRD